MKNEYVLQQVNSASSVDKANSGGFIASTANIYYQH